MMLRDYFATHADLSPYKFSNVEMMGEFLGITDPDKEFEGISEGEAVVIITARYQAKLRYISADAMLAAREAKP